jgi:parvulin-like peptidyl-prolyl isomerase
MLDSDITVNQPGIKELERQTKFDKNNVAVANKVAKELRKSELLLEKNINKDLLADLDEAKIRLGGVDRIFGSWRLNDEQYKEYQGRVARNVNEMFEDFRSLWDEKGIDADFRANTMTQILNSAKQKAAVEMKIGSME